MQAILLLLDIHYSNRGEDQSIFNDYPECSKKMTAIVQIVILAANFKLVNESRVFASQRLSCLRFLMGRNSY